jgi:hypothetical protein
MATGMPTTAACGLWHIKSDSAFHTSEENGHRKNARVGG